MCGIVGFIDPQQRLAAEDLQTTIATMTQCLAHRGPDHGDCWTEAAHGIALGHRRLAIVDLSPEGQQPMHSHDGRYVMVFNGEVYNFVAIRTQLEALGHRFRGTSDTEVMLAAIVEWGLGEALQRFNGMFALALWDRQTQTLRLLRDRIGIKPLYYGWSGGVFFFASELKALRAHPNFQADIDRDSLGLYFRHGFIPSPHSIYSGVRQLRPGHSLTLAAPYATESAKLETYWSLQQVAQQGIDQPFRGSEAEALKRLETRLRDSVRQRMVADVPLGAFLSGGIDSSLVVALMQAQSSQPVRSFTIGFEQEGFNEAQHARAVAEHLQTDHTELTVTAQDALDVIPLLPQIYDEPFADSSQIPTFLVSKLTRQHVTVSLSGDGGDELFAGYTTYRHAENLWRSMQRLPAPLRPMTKALSALSIKQWDALFGSGGTRFRTLSGKRMHRLSSLISQSQSREQLYWRLMSQWENANDIVLHSSQPMSAWLNPDQWLKTADYTQWMQALDMATYLPDDILVKVDRASMRVGLEARVPLLDHHVVEFAWTLPSQLNLKHPEGKWPLRQILYQYVPQALVDRPKKGFSVPLDQWLRGPLRDWASALLDPQKLSQQGYLNAPLVQQKWTEFLKGNNAQERNLWTALMFVAWLDSAQETAISSP